MAAAWLGNSCPGSQHKQGCVQEPWRGTHQPHGGRAAREGFGMNDGGVPGQYVFPGFMFGGFSAEKPLMKEEDALSRLIPCWFSS